MIVRFPGRTNRYEIAEEYNGIEWFVFNLITHLEKEIPISQFDLEPTSFLGEQLDERDKNLIKDFMNEYGHNLVKQYAVTTVA